MVTNGAIDLTFCMLTAYMQFYNICSDVLKKKKDFIDIGSSKIRFFGFLEVKTQKFPNSVQVDFQSWQGASFDVFHLGSSLKMNVPRFDKLLSIFPKVVT